MRSAAITMSLAGSLVFSVLWAVQLGNYKLLYCDGWLIENRVRLGRAELYDEVFAREMTLEQHANAHTYLVIAASGGKLRFRIKRVYDERFNRRLYVTTNEYAIRLGLLVFATAVPILFLTGIPWIRRILRHRSQRCIRCGYDLHGLTEPRCPECGTPFEKHEAEDSQKHSKP